MGADPGCQKGHKGLASPTYKRQVYGFNGTLCSDQQLAQTP